MAGYTVKNDAVDLRWQMYLTIRTGSCWKPISNGCGGDELLRRDKDWLPKVEQKRSTAAPELYAGFTPSICALR